MNDGFLTELDEAFSLLHKAQKLLEEARLAHMKKATRRRVEVLIPEGLMC